MHNGTKILFEVAFQFDKILANMAASGYQFSRPSSMGDCVKISTGKDETGAASRIDVGAFEVNISSS